MTFNYFMMMFLIFVGFILTTNVPLGNELFSEFGLLWVGAWFFMLWAIPTWYIRWNCYFRELRFVPNKILMDIHHCWYHGFLGRSPINMPVSNQNQEETKYRRITAIEKEIISRAEGGMPIDPEFLFEIRMSYQQNRVKTNQSGW